MSPELALRHLVSDHRLQRLCREWEARLPGAGVRNINNNPNRDTNPYAYPLLFEPYPEPEPGS